MGGRTGSADGPGADGIVCGAWNGGGWPRGGWIGRVEGPWDDGITGWPWNGAPCTTGDEVQALLSQGKCELSTWAHDRETERERRRLSTHYCALCIIISSSNCRH